MAVATKQEGVQQPLTVHISENGAKHVQEVARAEDKEGYGLHVAVKGGGCSGLTYVLGLAAEPAENDKVVEQNGIRLFVDKKSYIFLVGLELDYSGGINGKGFVFNNPNAKTTCGCGTSFSV